MAFQPIAFFRQHRLSLLILVLIAAGAAYWSKNHSSADSTAASNKPGGMAGLGEMMKRPTPVTAAPVTQADFPVYFTALGTVTPRNIVTVKTRIDGQLMAVHFEEGQLVKSGDVLADIDPRPYEVQLTQTEGQLARDKALLDNARLDLNRYRSLHTLDSISRQQLDTQESLVRQYEGAVKADQGQLDNARLQLSYTRITAPISGRVGLRQVDPGNIVRGADTTSLVVITQLQPITVVFTLAEDQLQALLPRLNSRSAPTKDKRKNIEKIFAVDAWDRENKAKITSGRLLTVDNQIDTTTGTVKLKALFDNQDNSLFPNQFVNARLHIDTLHDALTIPSAAIQRGAKGYFVYVVNEDNTVSVRTITPGESDGERTAIRDGLKAGEKVVVDGIDRLREGAKVELSSGKGGGKNSSSAANAPRPPQAAAPESTGKPSAPQSNATPSKP